MQHDEINIASIYNGEPAGTPEQEAAKRAVQRAQRAKLPKFELKEGEQFYISREKVTETIRAYSSLVDTVKTGFAGAPEELRSLMESVVTLAYKSDMEKQQEQGTDAAVNLDIIKQLKRQYLAAGYDKRWIFGRKKPNRALQQCMRQARAEANLEFAARDAEIAEKERFVYGIPEAPEEVEELYQNLIYELAPKRKCKKFDAKYGKRIMALLTDYTQNLVRILSDQFDEELKEKIAELEEQYAKEKAAEQEEQTKPIEVDAEGKTAGDGEFEETKDDAPDPEDFKINEGELDELDELEEETGEELDEDNQGEEPSKKVDLPPVAVAEQTAMVFVPMSAESAETANEKPENANGEDIDGEKKNE